jgi:hypothetical protein
MLAGFGSERGGFGLGGRTNARSPTAISRTPKPMLRAALRVSLVEKPVSPTRTPMVLTMMRTIAARRSGPLPGDRPCPGQVVSWSRKMTGLIAAPRASGMTSRSRLLIVPPASPQAGSS